MTAQIFLSCEQHPLTLPCEDDRAFSVETVAAARTLWAAMFPGRPTSTKVARVVIDCEIGGCGSRVSVSRVESVAAGRALAAEHNSGWYTARRAGGKLVDGCQYHLGACCIHHARRHRPGTLMDTVDRTAILPVDVADAVEVEQLDLFGGAL